MRCFILQILLFTLLISPPLAGAQTDLSPQVQVWMQKGSQLMQAGQSAEAAAVFRQAVKAAPSLPDAYMGLGLCELRLGQVKEAEEALNRVLALDPHAAGAHMFLGIAQYQSGDPAAAGNLRHELALQPDSVEALTWSGIIELAAGDAGAAAAPLDRAAALAPANEQILYYQARAHSQLAEQIYQTLYKLNPNSAIVHRALGENLSASGQPEKAIAEFQAGIEKSPNDADIYEDLGTEDQKLSRFDDAIKAYQQELKLNPNSAIALYNLGKIRLERGDPEAGVALLRQAVAAHGAIAPNAYYLGLGLSETGHNEEAAQWLERSLASQPSPFIQQSAYYQIARVYAKLGRKEDSQKAFGELERLKAASAVGISGGK